MTSIQRLLLVCCFSVVSLSINAADNGGLCQLSDYQPLHRKKAVIENYGIQSALPIMEGSMADAGKKLKQLAKDFVVNSALELFVCDDDTDNAEITITPNGALIPITAAIIKKGGIALDAHLKRMVTALCAYELYSAASSIS